MSRTFTAAALHSVDPQRDRIPLLRRRLPGTGEAHGRLDGDGITDFRKAAVAWGNHELAPSVRIAAHLIILRRKHQAFARNIEMGASVKRIFDINAASSRGTDQTHIRNVPHDRVRAQKIARIGGEIRGNRIGNSRFRLFGREAQRRISGPTGSPVSKL